MAKMDAELKHQENYISKLEKQLAELKGKMAASTETANNQLITPLTDREIELLRMVAGADIGDLDGCCHRVLHTTGRFARLRRLTAAW